MTQKKHPTKTTAKKTARRARRLAPPPPVRHLRASVGLDVVDSCDNVQNIGHVVAHLQIPRSGEARELLAALAPILLERLGVQTWDRTWDRPAPASASSPPESPRPRRRTFEIGDRVVVLNPESSRFGQIGRLDSVVAPDVVRVEFGPGEWAHLPLVDLKLVPLEEAPPPPAGGAQT